MSISVVGGITQANVDDVRDYVRRETGFDQAEILAFSEFLDSDTADLTQAKESLVFWWATLSGGSFANGCTTIAMNGGITRENIDMVRDFVRSDLGYPNAEIMAFSGFGQGVGSDPEDYLVYWVDSRGPKDYSSGTVAVSEVGGITKSKYNSVRDQVRIETLHKSANVMAFSQYRK